MNKIKKALISVSDKSNLKDLLKILTKYKVEFISSGGTYKEIRKLKFKCLEVSEYTGSPEILGGRVKTLHPKIHAGILSKRQNKKHKNDLKNNNFHEIDLVIVNFYPFEKTLEQTNNHLKIIENIDVGGPTMVRAAAKNYKDVTVITSSNQYSELINELQLNKGSTSLEFREKMSLEAFSETAYYDAVISNYFNNIKDNKFPKKKIIYGNLVENLRYGENPHQQAAVYSKTNSLNLVFSQIWHHSIRSRACNTFNRRDRTSVRVPINNNVKNNRPNPIIDRSSGWKKTLEILSCCAPSAMVTVVPWCRPWFQKNTA